MNNGLSKSRENRTHSVLDSTLWKVDTYVNKGWPLI